SAIGSPFTRVPLPEPMSLAAQPSPLLRKSTCLRETDVSGIETWLSVARPITASSPPSSNSSPAFGPAVQTSFAAARRAGIAPRDTRGRPPDGAALEELRRGGGG